MRATLLMIVLAMPAAAQVAAAQIATASVGGVAFSGFKTYWAEKRGGCQPMISFRMKNATSGGTKPVDVRMEVVDQSTGSAFAGGSASVPSSDLPPGQAKDIAIGADHDITPRDCLGDMHEMPLSAIHFTVRLTTMVGSESVVLLRDEPMSEERIPAQP